ncbi:MAPEG family protein [Sphingomonas bacterium]|uniref:MAPEG family protein n=1 Tax=Sphingomonas bacterium TaxID=1895847 RepID=UPI00157543C0|nr:MAPEG family protein [Sphingomonas bacterium]
MIPAVAHADIPKPVIVLIAWTLVMLAWMLATRLPAMRRAGADLATLVGSKASDADRSLPATAQWKAHNYNHLMEQPTLFYAVALVLAIGGWGSGINAGVAWIYVGLRIAHSIVQATINRVLWRFVLFIASSAALVVLTFHAALMVF